MRRIHVPVGCLAGLVACAAPSSDESPESVVVQDTAPPPLGAEWERVDPGHVCPDVDFEAPGTHTRVDGVVFDTPEGISLTLDQYLPDRPGARPAIVMVHGGSFVGGDPSYMAVAAEHYANAGFVVINVTYRKVLQTSFDQIVGDVVCATRWTIAHADELGIDPACLGTMGESAGAYLAAMAAFAAQDPAWATACEAAGDAVAVPRWSVPYYGIHDMVAYEADHPLGPGIASIVREAGQTPEAMSPVRYVGVDPALAVFLPHGMDDDAIPASQSQILHDALQQAGHRSEVRLLEGVPHGFVTGAGFDGDANQGIQSDIEAFVREALGGS